MLILTSIGSEKYRKNNGSYFLSRSCFKNWLNFSEEEKSYLNTRIPPYHWDNDKKFLTDYLFIKERYEESIKLVSENLNTLHGTNKDSRYWEIIIGPWYRTFISLIYERYQQILSLKSLNINSYLSVKQSDNHLVPFDTRDFYVKNYQDYWNQNILEEIIHFIFPDLTKNLFTYESDNKKTKKTKKFNKFKKNFKNLLIDFNSYLCKNNNTSYNFTSLSKIEILKLSLYSNVFPNFFDIPSEANNKLIKNNDIRDKFKLTFNSEDQLFNEILSYLIIKYFPLIFLEGFQDAKRKSLRKYPNYPKNILTLEGYLYADIFKIWAAENVTLGCKYFISQHGGNFGISMVNDTEEFQIKVSDHFYSWGWSIDNKIKVLPSSKLERSKNKKYDKKGSILLQINEWPRYSYRLSSVPHGPQQLDYFEEVYDFVDKTDLYLKEKIKIKFLDFKYGFNIKNKFEKLNKNIFLDKNISYLKALSQSRLSIVTTNSTCLLESLTFNIPTIIVFNKFFKVRKSSESILERLIEAKILFNSFHKVRLYLEKNILDIDKHWKSKKIQALRKDFLDIYGYTRSDWYKYWSKEINKNANLIPK